MGLLILRLAIVCSTGGLIVGYSGSADWPAICLGYVVGILAGLYLGAERECLREGEQAKAVDALAKSCRELLQAMRDYEMNVDTDPPNKHREMMERAEAAIEAA